jgi:cytoskeletal protein RodZ
MAVEDDRELRAKLSTLSELPGEKISLDPAADEDLRNMAADALSASQRGPSRSQIQFVPPAIEESFAMPGQRRKWMTIGAAAIAVLFLVSAGLLLRGRSSKAAQPARPAIQTSAEASQSPKEASPRETSPKEASPREAAPKEASPKAASPKAAAPTEAAKPAIAVAVPDPAEASHPQKKHRPVAKKVAKKTPAAKKSAKKTDKKSAKKIAKRHNMG